jgi:hypothetical protein
MIDLAERRSKKKPPAAAIGVLSGLFTVMILGVLPGGYVQLYVDVTLVLLIGAVISVMLWISFLFFRSRQLHLLELVIMVAAVGNVLGLLSRNLLADNPQPLKLFFFVLLSMSTLLIVSGGAAWGLYLAAAMRRDGTFARVLLVLLGIAAPTAVIAFIVSWLHLRTSATMPADERLLTQSIMGASVLLIGTGVGLHAYVRGLGAARRENA